MGKIILGIIAIAAGTGMVIKTEWLVSNFGRIAWFEKKLGAEGGTRLGYKLIGLLIIFIGIVVMTGSGPEFFGWVLSPLIKTGTPNY
ncbi:hypothetical protein GX917_01740 [Candidatus Falkowbacteria bacterium]|jgi:cytochrome b|nr:hypothetical protein [Candidatus Falkowbacteria bacterium]